MACILTALYSYGLYLDEAHGDVALSVQLRPERRAAVVSDVRK